MKAEAREGIVQLHKGHSMAVRKAHCCPDLGLQHAQSGVIAHVLCVQRLHASEWLRNSRASHSEFGTLSHATSRLEHPVSGMLNEPPQPIEAPIPLAATMRALKTVPKRLQAFTLP